MKSFRTATASPTPDVGRSDENLWSNPGPDGVDVSVPAGESPALMGP
ncbi:hypothetical protein ACFYXF_30435 [Streptomyces sp. NPDC002680]